MAFQGAYKMKLYKHQEEIWRQVNDYPAYQVSNLGNVRSVDRTVVDNHCNRLFKGKLLKQTILTNKKGYQCLYVTLSKNGLTRKFLVHRLVAEAFIDNPDNKEQVNHIDGNPLNNVVTNLEWCTNAENTNHAYRTMLNKKGQKLITFNGITLNLTQWSLKLGLNPKVVSWRLNHGWNIEKTLKELKL